MFSFLIKKSKASKAKTIYPSFTARIFTSLVDAAIAALILIPLSNIIVFAIYKDAPQAREISILTQQSTKASQSQQQLIQHLEQNPGYKDFIMHLSRVSGTLQLLMLCCIVFAFWSKTDSTPGKMLMSMKIVDDKTMQDPSSWQLFLRMLSYPLSVVPGCLGIFYIAMNKKHRAWHDLIAGTVVIYKK